MVSSPLAPFAEAQVTNKEYVALLGISLETVRRRLARLFARSGCVDEAQAGLPASQQLKPP